LEFFIKNKINKTKIIVFLGTRPEGIKLAPVIKLLEKNDKVNLSICSTGQHKEMLDQVLSFFNIKPDIILGLMVKNQSLCRLSYKILKQTDFILEKHSPDYIIVQGDTTTAFLTALSAYYKKIKICHVEAGLRTYDKYSPFPEEINRQFISRIADFNFVPTETAKKNLINEGILENTIFHTGNTIVDAMMLALKIVESKNNEIKNKSVFKGVLKDKKIILVTMHRRESFGSDIKNVCLALKDIACNNKNIQIIYPVHLNPNVRKPVYDILSNEKNILLMEPLCYEDFIWLMNLSYIIVTDSGGIQEEAPTLKKPVLVIRKKTERLESLNLGISKLIGTDKDKIIEEVQNLLDNKIEYSKMIPKSNPHGDGRASERILKIILNDFLNKDGKKNLNFSS